MIVRARAPLRVSLAGGGTDLSPYCDRHGGAVLNVTIDLYAYTVLEPAACDVTFHAADLDVEEGPHDGQLILHRAVYRRMIGTFNDGRALPCRITTFCDAPPGSGLGTSSTMVVSLVTAFVEWLNLPLDDYGIARLAFEIERHDAGLAGGRQDQYAATFGGVNFMEFQPGERVIVNPLRIKPWVLAELETSLLLFDSGTSRASAEIIRRQTDNLLHGGGGTLVAMHAIKADALHMKECLLTGDLAGFALRMRESWGAKKRLADGITTPALDAVVAAALGAGALAAKVSGAGGGGFVTILAPPERRMAVTRALAGFSGRVLPCHFTGDGAEGWTIR